MAVKNGQNIAPRSTSIFFGKLCEEFISNLAIEINTRYMHKLRKEKKRDPIDIRRKCGNHLYRKAGDFFCLKCISQS